MIRSILLLAALASLAAWGDNATAPRRPLTGAAERESAAEPAPATPAGAPAPDASSPAATPADASTGVSLLGGRLEFGSYGRVGFGSDLKGMLGTSANITAHGPRLLEDSYAELELRREDSFGQVKSRVVATLGFFPPFFQFSGNPAQQIGLRNLYAEASVGPTFSAWAGSRMYRGDDIYLLDFWPLDNLNTVGGGVQLTFGRTRLQAQVGMDRLDQPTTHQVVLADNPLGYGSVPVTLLDRPRIIGSMKLTHELQLDGFGARFSLYAEGHQMSAGVTRNTVTGDEQALPQDWGALAGAQASLFAPGNRFAHLWVRQATGLAVYDAFTTPLTVNNQRTTQGAQSTRVAFAGGWQSGQLGLLVGAYLDLVRDAGVSSVTSQKYDEGAAVARGQWAFNDWFGVAAEASVQRRVYGLVDPATGQLRSGTVGQLGLMPYFSPFGSGLFARPQLRVVYALSMRDAGARGFYPAEDVASQRGVSHYLGLSVEWWFNSTTHP